MMGKQNPMAMALPVVAIPAIVNRDAYSMVLKEWRDENTERVTNVHQSPTTRLIKNVGNEKGTFRGWL